MLDGLVLAWVSGKDPHKQTYTHYESKRRIVHTTSAPTSTDTNELQYHAGQARVVYIDLLLVITLLGAPPPAGLATLRGSLLAAAPLGLPAALRRLPLGGRLPARCATSLRGHGG